MNREILFKGFHPCKNGFEKVFVNGEWINGKWIYGFVSGLLSYSTDNKSGEITKIDSYYMNCYYDVLASTVGQYTGLTDKNDKKIFEGDIVKFTNDEGDSSLHSVQWSDFFAGWVMLRIEMTFEAELMDCWNDWRNYCEVIGNIHDNPELLEVAE